MEPLFSIAILVLVVLALILGVFAIANIFVRRQMDYAHDLAKDVVNHYFIQLLHYDAIKKDQEEAK